LMRIRDPGWRQFGSGMEKSRIWDKHPGSATLVLISKSGLQFFKTTIKGTIPAQSIKTILAIKDF
jgi:hypothetical protein